MSHTQTYSQTSPSSINTRRVLHVEVQFSKDFRNFDFGRSSLNINQFVYSHLQKNYGAVYTNKMLFVKGEHKSSRNLGSSSNTSPKLKLDDSNSEKDEIQMLTNMIEMIYIAEFQDGTKGDTHKPENIDNGNSPIKKRNNNGDLSIMLSFFENNLEVKVYAYTLCNEVDYVQRSVILQDSDQEDLPMPEVHFTPLPNRQLHGLWQSLIFDSNIKQKLIYYAQTLDCFSMFKLASELEITSPWCINFNRIILLYGPSGTGKTSLCKSLCQQISIRMQNKIFKSHESSSECGYSRFRLIEIPCHSMVSKWFGQSSMIISKYFECIENELKNSRESTYIFILFDEIESLLNSRESSVNNNDPSDVIRIVNTIIIRLDRLNNLVNTLNYSKKKTEVKKKCNFIVLATSNLITLIDSAFLDRADFTQYIGPPGIESIYSILLNCLNELLKYKILTYDGISLLPYEYAIYAATDSAEQALLKTSQTCFLHQLSPRFLAKLCMLAHSRFLLNNSFEFINQVDNNGSPSIPLYSFLVCMDEFVIEKYSKPNEPY